MNTATTAADRYPVRSISVDDVYSALSEGWADFRAAPEFGLFFGGVYAFAGILIFLQLWVWDQPFWILPLALAFPLIGPFAAIGLYEVSRRREKGEPLVWAEILDVIWRERTRQMPTMAFIVLAGFMFWMWSAAMLIAIVLGRMNFAVYSDIGALLTTGNGLLLLFLGTIVGGAIALVLFSVTAVSLPMLLDREVDYVTAMLTSYTAVTRNPVAMLTWAAIVAVGLFVAMVPFFLGLFIALPVLGHTTWHIYRKVVPPEGAA
ncbi:MAG TPA: DUF2189 domain-containing protein [Amaricoccus sp.]|uniref:DUF2189 domain-containing protein n=1 Tax=Amaricoccus sp. TaxID=1872485 RepID=UPI001D2139C0|nr:DUF2189 domain-containing protein [Amaricoccus sp.]MCB1372067.1 DUF2189 domain-containing protein [Paracoccaceae bacterium]HPG23045.1 DUF2189 domain-containing protein [Amaricoccus sp.]HRW15435.1 DUF2189 domain-containing protein [Amaricoccus sp.]